MRSRQRRSRRRRNRLNPADAMATPPAANGKGAGGHWPTVAALALLLGGAGLHLAYLTWNCPIDLSGDEAHYWEWSRHLDISYYSKGPLVAYIIAGGRALLGDWSQRMVGNEMLAVRVPAIALSLLTGIGIYTLGVLVLRSRRVALGAVALTCTVPIFAVGAMLMTIDAPLACCYVWDAGVRRVRRTERARVAVGGGGGADRGGRAGEVHDVSRVSAGGAGIADGTVVAALAAAAVGRMWRRCWGLPGCCRS